MLLDFSLSEEVNAESPRRLTPPGFGCAFWWRFLIVGTNRRLVRGQHGSPCLSRCLDAESGPRLPKWTQGVSFSQAIESGNSNPGSALGRSTARTRPSLPFPPPPGHVSPCHPTCHHTGHIPPCHPTPFPGHTGPWNQHRHLYQARGSMLLRTPQFFALFLFLGFVFALGIKQIISSSTSTSYQLHDLRPVTSPPWPWFSRPENGAGGKEPCLKDQAEDELWKPVLLGILKQSPLLVWGPLSVKLIEIDVHLRTAIKCLLT